MNRTVGGLQVGVDNEPSAWGVKRLKIPCGLPHEMDCVVRVTSHRKVPDLVTTIEPPRLAVMVAVRPVIPVIRGRAGQSATLTMVRRD